MTMKVSLRFAVVLFLTTIAVEGRLGGVGDEATSSRQLQTDPFLEIVGQNGDFTVYPLGVCQGDCDEDKDVRDY